ncbi:MAG: type III pantothenate kinase [Phycisphaerae bacterium]|nr:type III pantothenate kinase [Phycisphaerae bacterium]
MKLETLPNVLACDCGNSTIQIAHVHGESVSDVRTFRLGELKPLGSALAELWEQMESPKAVVASSVNPTALKALEAAAQEAIGQDTLVVGRELSLPMETKLAAPQSIGTDRLCCAVAAYDRLGAACVVADFGTAVTIDCVDENGVFLGGAILPGLKTAAKALADSTAALPEVEFSAEPDWVFGGDTQQAIVGGLIFGLRGALKERVEAYATELGNWPLVILTGGDAKLICPNPGEADIVQAVVDDLPLRGIAIAYYKTLL